MPALDENHHSREFGLDRILSVWPVISCIASHVSAGDLISLSRTSTTIRNLTHGFPRDEQSDEPEPREVVLRLGHHQTVLWANLKASSQFECSLPTHSSSKPHPTRPCKFCSRPVCQACIVRTFFTNPHENTFKHRTRYLCPTCWESGNLRKDFRYPIDNISREQLWRGRKYSQRGSYCSCSASADNWLCIACKDLQNHSSPTNQGFAGISTTNLKKRKRLNIHVPLENVKCFGLDCTNEIFEADRERRRICLWCSKALPRQFAGEDRLRWESRQVEIRAASAASRSADIAEWARNRFRSLTMSREEMRGREVCEGLENVKSISTPAQILFVRHLDAVNYRTFMSEEDAPSPDSVYQSKHGRWTYTRGLFYKVNDRFRKHKYVVGSVNGVSTTDLFNMTHTKEGLRGARTNLTLSKQVNASTKYSKIIDSKYFTSQENSLLWMLVRRQAVLWEARLLPFGQSVLDIVDMVKDAETLETLVEQLTEHVEEWEGWDDLERGGWTPPSLKLIIEDVEESLKLERIMKEQEEDETNSAEKISALPDQIHLPNRHVETQARNNVVGDSTGREEEHFSDFSNEYLDHLSGDEDEDDKKKTV